MIFKLKEFWTNKGFFEIHPDENIMGAATFHPSFFLNLFNNKDFSIFYTQGCYRKADGRYGESPNRLLRHHQFQVVIKPAPDNVLDLYFDSLKYIGITSKTHDLQLFENNWETLSLGAFGYGWEALCNRMEITQLTYFQKIGDMDLPYIPFEIAYGIERLALFYLNIDSIWKAKWNNSLSYYDLFNKFEYEFSKYYLQKNNKNFKAILNDIFKEIQELFNEGMYYVAYIKLLELNDQFNNFDAMNLLTLVQRKEYTDKLREITNIIIKNI